MAARPAAPARAQAAAPAEPKRLQVAGDGAGQARQTLEQAKTLPLAEARQAALGLAKTQPLAAVVEPPAAQQPRRVRPVAPLPTKPMAAAAPVQPVAPPAPVKPITPLAAARPIAPIAPPPAMPIAAAPVRPVASITPIASAKPAPAPAPVQVSAPAVRAGILPGAAVDDGWSQGRKRSRGEPARPLRPLKLAEGTQPGVSKPATPAVAAAPKAGGKHATPARATAPAVKAVPVERPKLAEGSIPPPPASTTGKPLPSLFSVIDAKKPEPQSAGSGRLPGLPPPPPARPSIGPKKAMSTVVAAASLGSAQMAIAATRQTGEHALVPQPAQMLLDDEFEEIEELEPDLPDFVPSSSQVASMLMRAKSNPAPLFDAPPRAVAMPPAAHQFSAAEAAFFAAGEEMDTIDMEPGQDSFDDLPGIERPSFWSRLKNRASAGH